MQYPIRDKPLFITADREIFACFVFREFVILGLFTKSSSIRELSISMIGSAIKIMFANF